MIDYNGIRMLFYPLKPSNIVGDYVKKDVWNKISGSNAVSGIFPEIGSDGIKRYFAWKALSLPGGNKPYMYVVYAIPRKESTAIVFKLFIRNMIIIMAVALLGIIVSSYSARKLFGHRLERIVAATSMLKEGKMSVRLGNSDKSNDLGQICLAIDSMAETIEQRSLEQKQYTEELSKNLLLKEALLNEVHHRVKNNLQIILSMLRLLDISDDEFKKYLEPTEKRIEVMSIVHNMLFQDTQSEEVSFLDFLQDLLGLVSRSTFYKHNVEICLDIEDTKIKLEKAVPLGLLLNELVTNAYKHAFLFSTECKIKISFKKEGEKAKLSICDNGKSLADNFSIEAHKGLGLKMVEALSKQLGGSFSYKAGNWTCFNVDFFTRK